MAQKWYIVRIAGEKATYYNESAVPCDKPSVFKTAKRAALVARDIKKYLGLDSSVCEWAVEETPLASKAGSR